MHTNTQIHRSAVLALFLLTVLRLAKTKEMLRRTWAEGKEEKTEQREKVNIFWVFWGVEHTAAVWRHIPSPRSTACWVRLWTVGFVLKLWSNVSDLLRAPWSCGRKHQAARRVGKQQPHCYSSHEGCETPLPISLQVSALSPLLPVADVKAQQTIKISNI